jgi:hypothetical protein
MERRSTREPEESQLGTSTGVLKPDGTRNCGVCRACSMRYWLPTSGRISARAMSPANSNRHSLAMEYFPKISIRSFANAEHSRRSN